MCVDNIFCEKLADSSKVWVLLIGQNFNYLAQKGAQQDTNCPKSSWSGLMTTVFNIENGEINKSKSSRQR